MADNRQLKIIKWTIGAVLAIYILPYLFLGDNAYIRLHDTLEGEWMWLKMLGDSHTAFDFSPATRIAQQMQGLYRNAFPPGLTVNMVLVQWLGMYQAYIVDTAVIHLIGFGSMALLLRDYVLKQKDSYYIVLGCSLIFAVLPVFIPFGISVMGQPLLLWAFFNLFKRKQLWVSYAIIGLFPFYSTIVWVLVPFGLTLLGLGLYQWYKRDYNLHFVFAGVLFLCMYLVVNYPMLSLQSAHPDFVSHRSAYNLYMFQGPQLSGALWDVFFTFFTVHYHVASFVPLICLTAFLLTVRRSDKVMIAMFVTIVAIAFYQGFYSYIEFYVGNKLPIVNSFRFNRFSIVLPVMWMLLFALSLEKMRQSNVLKAMVLPLVFMQLFIALIGNDELLHNYRNLVGQPKFPAFNNFLAPRQFAQIKRHIGQPVQTYYVASFGLSPTIAQYNGFYTLDGLASIYDMHYKEQFRQIFLGEINKSEDVKQYFDGWGNRCYIFSAELGTKSPAYNCYKTQHKSVEHFDFNAKAFQQMGGKYLISAVEIKNYKEQGLALDKIFNDTESWWTIYLYSIKQ